MQTISLPDSTVIQIPPDLAADMQAAKFKKLPVFFRQFETIHGGCSNCGGEGRLWMQFAKGGPYQAPAAKGVSTFENGHWWQVESKFYTCPACGSHQTRINFLFEASGLEPEERDWRLEYIEGMNGKDAALDSGRNLLTECPRPTGWYAVYGPYGVGKSGMLRSIVAACCRALVSARYVRAEDILREMRATFGDDSNIGEDELLQKYGHYQVLAIDEVDRVSDTRWSRSALFSLLDMRYNRRNQLATLLATNCNPERMPAGFEYLQSRMLESQRVEMSGQDLRDSSEPVENKLF